MVESSSLSGPTKMHLYGLIIGISIAIGVYFFSKHNQVIAKNRENLFIFLVLMSSIIGARLYHVFDYWSYYSENLWQIPDTRGGGLAIYGALIGGLLAIAFFSFQNKLSLLKITNLITPILPLCQSIGRFGNYFNQEVYSPSGQPVWLYESILTFLLFLVLIKSKTHQTAVYLIGYGIIRFFLEFLRTDTWAIGNIKIAQVISLVFIILGVIIKNHGQSRETTISSRTQRNSPF